MLKRVAVLTSIILALPTTSISSANETCSNLASSYQTALTNYSTSSNKTSNQYKELVELKKTADRSRESCIKSINEEYKKTLKGINEKYATSLGTKVQKLAAKTQKANEIAAATLLRDESMKALISIPALPDKPANSGKPKKKP
jgi:L-lactate utilization protein LutB